MSASSRSAQESRWCSSNWALGIPACGARIHRLGVSLEAESSRELDQSRLPTPVRLPSAVGRLSTPPARSSQWSRFIDQSFLHRGRTLPRVSMRKSISVASTLSPCPYLLSTFLHVFSIFFFVHPYFFVIIIIHFSTLKNGPRNSDVIPIVN